MSGLARIALERVNVQLAGRHVLKDIDWSLELGQHWAIVGANGSGKSTLLRTIAGTQWIADDGGRRTYSPDGITRDVVARAASWIRLVGPEQHEYYARLALPLSGRDVIASGFDDAVYLHAQPSAAQLARIDALVAQFDLGAFAGRPLRELSSGQLRRLLIARALAGQPRVIVLDEFTDGLDRSARADVLAALDQLAERVALVIASHRPGDFPAATTHTATLRDGRLVRSTTGRPGREQFAAPALPSMVAPTDIRPAEPAESGLLIDIRGADVYRGRTRVLANISWQLAAGQHTLIRGANGSGKSTFAGLIAGTISAATGAEITRFGRSGPFDIWQLKERIAHVSDDLQIAYDQADSAADVVASGFAASIGLILEPTRAQRAAADAIVRRLGLEPLRERNFARLSFGERRKLLIARSLVRRPTIFLLDEVWNGLDAGFRSALRELLTEMAGAGTTIVAIAHDEADDLGPLGRRVCTIVDGGIHTSEPSWI